MARVTDEEVQAVTGDSSAVTSFVTTANLIVTDELGTSGLSDSRLKQIELYLAAHFWAITNERGGLVEKEVDNAKERYAGTSTKDTGFRSTRFGQQAMALDTTGVLASLASAGTKAVFRVI